MTILAAPGDTLRVRASDVKMLDENDVAQPVTADLVATLNVHAWDSDELESGPHLLAESVDDDWYVDIDAPTDRGRYRLKVALAKDGAARTLHGELKVDDPPT